MKRSLFAALAVIFGFALATSQRPPAATHGAMTVPDRAPLIARNSRDAHGDRPEAALSPRPASHQHASAVQPTLSAPGPDPAPVPDPDLIATESPLDQAMLTRLVRTGEMTLDLPNGHTLTLSVDQVDEQPGHQRIRVRGDSGSGQFTRAAKGFFGTIATSQGVYSFENQGLKTYIVNHSDLDRRNLPGLDDSRVPIDA